MVVLEYWAERMATLYQLHLARLDGDDADAFDLAVGGLQHLETQAFFLDHFAFLRDASGQLADQAGDGGGFLALGRTPKSSSRWSTSMLPGTM